LDAPRAAERGNGEAGDVAGREHVVAATRPPELVDADAVVDLEADRFGETRRRDYAQPGDDDVRLDRRAVLRRHRSRSDLLDELPGENGNALLAVVVVDAGRARLVGQACGDNG